MAKRFTDSNKWDKPWYRNLPSEYKCFWDFILSKCDLAGVWDVDFEGASYHIGSKINPIKAREMFSDQIKVISSKRWFVLDFIVFQYGERLNPKSPIHKKVNEILTRYSLHATLQDRIANRVKEEDKEEEEEVVKVKEEENPEVDSFSSEVINYLNEKTGSSYRKDGSKNKTFINARQAEGFTMEAFKAVIDHKASTWGQDPKMREYLRPETLFGTKFESYLNAARAAPITSGIEKKLIANEQVKNLYQNEPDNNI